MKWNKNLDVILRKSLENQYSVLNKYILKAGHPGFEFQLCDLGQVT